MNSHVNDLKTVSKLILICGCSHSCFVIFTLSLRYERWFNVKNVLSLWRFFHRENRMCVFSYAVLAFIRKSKRQNVTRKCACVVAWIREWITHFYGHLICRHLRLSRQKGNVIKYGVLSSAKSCNAIKCLQVASRRKSKTTRNE